MTDDRCPKSPSFPGPRRTDSFPNSGGPRHYNNRVRWRSNVPNLDGSIDVYPDRCNRTVDRSRVDRTTTGPKVPFLPENTRLAEPPIRPKVGIGLRIGSRGPGPSMSEIDAGDIEARTHPPGQRSPSGSAPHLWGSRPSWQGMTTMSSDPAGLDASQPGGTSLIRGLAHEPIHDRPHNGPVPNTTENQFDDRETIAGH